MNKGDVVLIKLPPPDPQNPTHVQAGTRPAIVVQHGSDVDRLATVAVVPLTSRVRARRFPNSVEIRPDEGTNNLNARSVALVHQITTVDRRRDVDRTIGSLSAKDLGRLDSALTSFLGLEAPTADPTDSEGPEKESASEPDDKTPDI